MVILYYQTKSSSIHDDRDKIKYFFNGFQPTAGTYSETNLNAVAKRGHSGRHSMKLGSKL